MSEEELFLQQIGQRIMERRKNLGLDTGGSGRERRCDNAVCFLCRGWEAGYAA